MKKTIYLIGIAASIMGGITSCTLDAEDYVTKSSENFPATTRGCHTSVSRYLSELEPSVRHT